MPIDIFQKDIILENERALLRPIREDDFHAAVGVFHQWHE